MSDLVRFWLRSAPAALYRVRWWTVGVMIAEIAIAVIIAVWTLRSPEAMSAVGTPQERDDYARSMFESYYTRYEPSDFAVQVWTNNARIAAVCVASGITGILPAYMLFINAFSVGKAAAIMADHDALGLFFALITPHGLLELTCIFIAGGAGLRLFWTLLAPGPRSRGAALAAEGRALITVAVTLTAALAVAGLIEVGAGFHPDLTGRENVFLNGAILGMTKKQIEDAYDSIVEFSEIPDFMDTEVKFYSSGMFLRLAFAVAVHSDPEVFLIDEILAVGDEPFQRKCLDEIRGLSDQGKTLVIVSHDLNMVSDLCERGVLLDKGVKVADGPSKDVVRRMRGE